jgi:hypothetical protein
MLRVTPPTSRHLDRPRKPQARPADSTNQTAPAPFSSFAVAVTGLAADKVRSYYDVLHTYIHLQPPLAPSLRLVTSLDAADLPAASPAPFDSETWPWLLSDDHLPLSPSRWRSISHSFDLNIPP